MVNLLFFYTIPKVIYTRKDLGIPNFPNLGLPKYGGLLLYGLGHPQLRCIIPPPKPCFKAINR